jgi:hypothetical protein
MQDYFALAQAAVNQLALPPGQTEHEAEENKAKVTRRTGFLIHQQNPNIGLLRKDIGNRSIIVVNGVEMGMSVDILLDKSDGTFVDVASDEALSPDSPYPRRVKAVWVDHQETSDDPTWLGRWIKPTAALTELEDGQEPGNGNGNGTDGGTQPDLAGMELQLASITESLKGLIQLNRMQLQTIHHLAADLSVLQLKLQERLQEVEDRIAHQGYTFGFLGRTIELRPFDTRKERR